MTTNKVADIRSYSFKPEDRLFFDANVWLSVYGPVTRKRKRSVTYSKALRDIRQVGCAVYVNVLVLSEFVNAYARWEHRQSFPHFPDFKAFRQSPSFPAVAQDIAQNAKRIVKQCVRCGSRFNETDLDALFTEFARGGSDFNDQMIAEACRAEGLTVVTDDADFSGTGLDIVTANNRLLSS